jgi:hypothetical protein
MFVRLLALYALYVFRCTGFYDLLYVYACAIVMGK